MTVPINHYLDGDTNYALPYSIMTTERNRPVFILFCDELFVLSWWALLLYKCAAKTCLRNAFMLIYCSLNSGINFLYGHSDRLY